MVPELPMGFQRSGRFVAFAGIGRPEKFYATAAKLGLDIADIVSFEDHHVYSQSDIDSLRLKAEERGARLLTTTKDYVRLPSDLKEEVIVLPIKVVFDKKESLDQLLELCLRSFKS
jgi:tetraacyldisaccharide 4'-kinase